MSGYRLLSSKNLPTPGVLASAREHELLKILVDMIEENAHGLFKNGLESSYVSGSGITEYEALLNPAYRIYLQKPGNIYHAIQKLVADMSENECRLFYCVLIEIEKCSSKKDKILIGKNATESKFNLDHALEIARPIIDHYLSKKLEPESHKVPGQSYRPRFMQVAGLRPNSKHEPVLVTEQLLYHASCAIILDALKLNKYNDEYQISQSKFEHDKIIHRQHVWDIVSMPNYTPGKKTSEYMPVLHKNAFSEIDFPNFTRIRPAFVVIKSDTDILIETSGAVAIHPDNQNCLTEFVDHTLDQPKKKYAVSKNEPPMSALAKSIVFDNIEDAFLVWEMIKNAGCPFLQIYMADA